MAVYFFLFIHHTCNEIKHQYSERLMVIYASFCYLEDLVLLALINLSCHAAVSQSVLDDVFVRLGAGLLVQLGS